MASSGTVSAPELIGEFRPSDRGNVMQMYKMRIKSTAVIEAGDLTLRTIQGAVLQQYAHADAVGPLSGVYGSVNTQGSLMNALTIKTLKGSQNAPSGTTHIGTIAGGTQQLTALITGA